MPFYSTLFFEHGRNMMVTEHNISVNNLFDRKHTSKRQMWRNMLSTILLLLAILIIGACHKAGTGKVTSEPKAVPGGGESKEAAIEHGTAVKTTPQAAPKQAPQTPAEISLFDGKTLGNWKITDFGGQGKVYVKDGCIYMEQGNDMTGITWAGPLVRMNYEITLEAMRVSGSDFFCGLTFPVNNNCCSLILGGWGGSLCGLSNIDYYDAANNQTTRFVSFENGKWYHVRLRVVSNHITAWILEEGQEPLVDIDITGRKIDTRVEVDLSKPLGIATWQTAGAVRNIKLRKLSE
jgi:hypothetical protein